MSYPAIPMASLFPIVRIVFAPQPQGKLDPGLRHLKQNDPVGVIFRGSRKPQALKCPLPILFGYRQVIPASQYCARA